MNAAQQQGRAVAEAIRARIIPLRQPSGHDLSEWARYYPRLNLRVHPLRAREKPPATLHGVHDATTDLERIRAWWRENPEYNIGLACGGGLIVLDIDHRHGGIETFDQLLAEHHFPACPMVTTNDGLHVYLHDPGGQLGTLTKLGPGVEARGAGYYVAAPPSIHPSGRRYTWAKGHGPVETRGLPPIPTSLLDVLDPPKPEPATKRGSPVPTPLATSGLLQSNYGRVALAGLLEDVERAVPGSDTNGRHPTLYKAACRVGELARGGHVSAVDATGVLFDTAVSAFAGHYSERHIRRTIEDGILRPARGGNGGVA